MAHGAGGKASRRLVEGLFAPLLFGSSAEPLGDAAHVAIDGARIAITTDSFVVRPLRFPGGSIGELAVNGTVNDLAVSGARGRALVVTYVLEAGLPTERPGGRSARHGRRRCARRRRDRGRRHQGGRAWQGGRMYITTAGIGRICCGVNIDPPAVRPGDKVLLSGPIGDHGITILLARGELDLEADLCSDTRSVLPLVEALVDGGRRQASAGCATRLAAASPRHSTNWRATAGLCIALFEERHSGARRSPRRLRIARPRSAAHRQ